MIRDYCRHYPAHIQVMEALQARISSWITINFRQRDIDEKCDMRAFGLDLIEWHGGFFLHSSVQ